jgi:YidC/Oxa1 family membrane protein insertase
MEFINSLIGTPLGYIMFAVFGVVKNYGLALIIFTILTKIILFPLAIKQQKTSVKSSLFQPKIQALQKQYANNKEKLQEETSKLYAEEGHNPLSGCLPILLQLPLLFGLIDVVYKPITHILRLPKETINSAFEIAKKVLGASISPSSPQISIIEAFKKSPSAFEGMGADFTTKIQTLNLNFLGINLGEKPTIALNMLILIPVLSGLTSLLVSYVSMKKGPTANVEQAGSMKTMMYIMPLFSAFFTLSVPAGVGLYWIISNIVAIAQVYVLNFFYNPEKLREQYQQEADERKKAKKQEKKSKPVEKLSEKSDVENKQTKETASNKLAEARRRMAEKYGENEKGEV